MVDIDLMLSKTIGRERIFFNTGFPKKNLYLSFKQHQFYFTEFSPQRAFERIYNNSKRAG